MLLLIYQSTILIYHTLLTYYRYHTYRYLMGSGNSHMLQDSEIEQINKETGCMVFTLSFSM